MKALEQQISKKIYHFDIHALLALLHSMGYQEDEILFKSNMTTKSSNALLHNIEFRTRPIRQVVITVNLGLFSVHSPLPSYFMKIIELENVEEKSFCDFIEFFDHKLISSYLSSIYPETDSSLYPNWEATKRGYLRLLNLKSVAIAHHVFALVFPELGMSVQKGTHKRYLPAIAFRLGENILGDTSVLGGKARVNVPGLDVTLYCDEELTEGGKPWADEIFHRLQKLIFPVLKEVDVHIKIILVIRSQKAWLQLQQRTYLGVDRIRGASGQDKTRVVVIFEGQVPYQ